MIWHYHNAGGLLLVASAPYSMLLSPSLLPFFRSSSHPRAVFCASTHTFLGWWGGARSRAPLFTTPLPPTAASPSSPNCSAAISPPSQPPSTPARIMRINTRGSLQGQRRRYSFVDLLRAWTFFVSLDVHTHRDRRPPPRAYHRSSVSFLNCVRFHAHMHK